MALATDKPLIKNAIDDSMGYNLCYFKSQKFR